MTVHSKLDTKHVLALGLCLGMMGTALEAMASLDATWSSNRGESAGGGTSDSPYSSGQRALDAGDYEKASTLFREAVDKSAEPVDAALYWLAYAQSKTSKKNDALSTLQRLRERYPKSGWLDDARALEIDLTGKSEGSGKASSDAVVGEDEEIKLYALQSLLNAEPDRAVPTIERFLAKPHSRRLEEQALFVLSQADSPRAKQVLSEIALGNQHPQLRLKAIEQLGIAGDEESRRLLGDVYAKSNDLEVKRKVLEAFMVGDDKTRVLQAAKGEASVELRGKAIELLGVMDAIPELRQLYATEKSTELRRKIIDAYIVADDAERLAEIARTEPDPELRMQAVRNLGVVGGEKATAALKEIYRSSTDVEVKRAVLDSFFVSDDVKALLEVAKGEKNRDLRREALQKLSQMDSPEALDFLSKQLDQ
ncbi:MAG: HEAT repeat domain-containing protein [Acidobacteriota bacterium]